MAERKRAAPTATRTPKEQCKDTYFSLIDNVYYELFKALETICEASTSTIIVAEQLSQLDDFYRPRKLSEIMENIFNPANHSTPTKAKEAKI